MSSTSNRPEEAITVSREELESYMVSSFGRKARRLSNFWKEICRSTPKELREELNGKGTDLRSIYSEEGVYKFITWGASDRLRQFISNFKVIVK